MNGREFAYQPERRQLPPKVYEGEILPPLPKQSVVQDEAQVKERIQVIRTELTHYIQKPPRRRLSLSKGRNLSRKQAGKRWVRQSPVA